MDLRDRTGLVQIVVQPDNPALFATGETLRSEFVVAVSGVVRRRPDGTINANLPTGEIEILAQGIEILNASQTLPFEISQYSHVSEEVRLQYRYLDLRRPRLQRNLILRHKICQAIRAELNRELFLEIQTPMLTKSTPEGARDYLVPSRLNPGSFYALPQSPQIFKQILMVGGMEKYYQIVRCFRDEDLRSDRQPEFTQIDIEMSFADESDVMILTEKLVAAAFEVATGKKCRLLMRRVTYQEAMDRYGSDRPDLRYGLEITDLSEILKDCQFQVFANVLKSNGIVRALRFPEGGSFSRSEIDNLTQFVIRLGAKGLAWMKFTAAGAESNIVKYFTPAELTAIAAAAQAKEGDILFFAAGPWKGALSILGSLRQELAKRNQLIKDKDQFEFLWVTDFPLLEKDEKENRWSSMHHPFTAPQAGDVALLDSAPGKVRARAYDIVLNGTELGGGSIRIHRGDLQKKVFGVLGVNEESAKEKFGFLIDALNFGAPPHGGIALGLDRMVAIFLGEDSIRDTIAFPKTQKGVCLMSGSPSPVSANQLKELSINVHKPLTGCSASS